MLAARALCAFEHVNPWRTKREDLADLALVGGLLHNEALHSLRAQIDKPMTITFVSGKGPTVEPVALARPERPDTTPKGSDG